MTCEVTPHHLTLTDEEVARSGYDTRFKVNPPLRSEADRQALVAALSDGTIDCVATDHAPHHADEKALEFADAPFGVIGLETALPVLVDALLVPRHVSLMRLVEVLATAPARLFGMYPRKGSISVGADADIVIYDGHCRFCWGQVRRLHRLDWNRRLAFLSCTIPRSFADFPTCRTSS